MLDWKEQRNERERERMRENAEHTGYTHPLISYSVNILTFS